MLEENVKELGFSIGNIPVIFPVLLLRNFFRIYPREKMLDENDVEFDFSIDNVLVFFSFL